MVIFGGIIEITKELDDLVLFDIDNTKWVQLFEELQSPLRLKTGSFITP